MNELDLYKFLESVPVDWRGEELIVWIPFDLIKDFTNMIGCGYFSESGHDANLQYDCIAIDLIPICEHFEIDPKRILEKTE